MKYLLLGAGLQGTAIAHDLLNFAKGTTSLHLMDANDQALSALAARLDDPRVRTTCGDVTDSTVVGPLMAAADVAVSAVNYWFNADLAELAVANNCHFLDLGGNNDIVAREFALDDDAQAAGVTIVPDCGLAPGLAGILGYWLADGLDEVSCVRLRVGGLPREPRPPMNYKVVFSVQGLINEYIEPAVVIRDGRLQTVPSLTELEPLVFPEPFGELEAFQTSGGTSTLPESLLGRVPDLDYKTIRYRGHCAQVRLLHELGLTDNRSVEMGGVTISPRQVLAHCMDQALTMPGDDVVLVLCWAEGMQGGQAVRRSVRIIDRHDHDTDLSAMMRMTGFPAAIIAAMLASGDIAAPGARRQELIVPGDHMLDELRRRGIEVKEWTSDPGSPM
ncbi:saccharopine dehydrogenase [bacterium]|nr:MAG: saccharopine dehydrogenase [bacterium]